MLPRDQQSSSALHSSSSSLPATPLYAASRPIPFAEAAAEAATRLQADPGGMPRSHQKKLEQCLLAPPLQESAGVAADSSIVTGGWGGFGNGGCWSQYPHQMQQQQAGHHYGPQERCRNMADSAAINFQVDGIACRDYVDDKMVNL